VLNLPRLCRFFRALGLSGVVIQGCLSYLNKVVVRAIKVFVQLYDQTLEEGRELPFLLAGLWERNRDCGGRTGTVGPGSLSPGRPTPARTAPQPLVQTASSVPDSAHTHPRTPGETWARTYIIQELPLHPQLPGGNAAIRILGIRLRRVKSIGDIKTQLPLLL
jgi:hypothetical protein